MIIDNKLVLATDAAMSGTDTTAYTTNTIDLGVAGRTGMPDSVKYMEFDITTSYSGGTSVRYGIYDSADDSTFGKASEGRTILIAAALAGTKVRIPFPEDTKRYVKGGVFTVGATTAGKCTVFITE